MAEANPRSVDNGNRADDHLSSSDCKLWRQGDHFDYQLGLAIDGKGEVRTDRYELGVVLISQSCDVVLKHRQHVQIAPVVVLDEKDAAVARLNRRPQYLPLSHLADEKFADLDRITTVDKNALTGAKRTPSPTDDDLVRRFSNGVGRKFARFAFPDEVDQSLKPLQSLVQSKAPKEQSPLGLVLADLAELRVRSSNGWIGPSYEVVLIFVTQPDALPEFATEIFPAVPDALMDEVFDDEMRVTISVNEVAQRLVSSDISTDEKYWLWEALGTAAAQLCADEAAKLGYGEVVLSVTHEISAADQFPLTLVRKSETLDLDHLSDPTPL